jgi:hypothetical protein
LLGDRKAYMAGFAYRRKKTKRSAVAAERENAIEREGEGCWE